MNPLPFILSNASSADRLYSWSERFFYLLGDEAQSSLAKGDLEKLFAQNPKKFIGALKVMVAECCTKSLLKDEILDEVCDRFNISDPVFVMPPVIHVTGSNFSLDGNVRRTKLHQDFPRQKTSLNAATIWVPVYTADPLQLAGLSFWVSKSSECSSQNLFVSYDASGDVDSIRESDLLLSDFEEIALKCDLRKFECLVFDHFSPHSSIQDELDRISVSFRISDINCSDWQDRNYELAWHTSFQRGA